MRLALTLVAALLWAGHVASHAAQQSLGMYAQIAESTGRLGYFQLGSSVALYASYVRPSMSPYLNWWPAAGLAPYSTADNAFSVFVDPQGLIHEIATVSPEMFTERFVRPGVSNVAHVLQTYGAPATLDRSQNALALVYPLPYGTTLRFWVSAPGIGAASANAAALYQVPLSAISVSRTAGPPMTPRQLPQAGYATVCATPVWTCPLGVPMSVGATCFCPTPQGNAFGISR